MGTDKLDTALGSVLHVVHSCKESVAGPLKLEKIEYKQHSVFPGVNSLKVASPQQFHLNSLRAGLQV